MTTLQTRHAAVRDIEEAVASEWAGSDGRRFSGYRLVHGQVAFPQRLCELLRWETTQTTVYSALPDSDEETFGVGEFQLVTAPFGEPWDKVKSEMMECPLPEPLRWFGAFAFGDNAAPGVWSEWPRAFWFVPALTLIKTTGSDVADVYYVAAETDSEADCRQELRHLLAGLDGIERNSEFQGGLPQSGSASVRRFDTRIGDVDDEAAWSAKVDSILDAIGKGGVSKIVLARQALEQVELPLSEAVERLSQRYASSHVFALFRGSTWFLAASPEQLVQTKQGRVYVDCLAGTTLRGDTREEDEAYAAELFESPKNRREHKAVVDFVRERLETIADQLTIPAEPIVKRLQNVQHLYTPVEGTLKAGCHLFDAAMLLHPTPAVAGVPRDVAIQWIEATEGWNRGYYAGAFGSVDANGDGRLHVSLRSACIAYPDAVLFAGCGIVEGSDPRQEWEESELKLKPMRWAIRRRS
ncbi:isochorismate synthase [Alicyclobacillus acidiphilus]|uniref:isochorismate synthase n=1 Tax=Alicyclobacillus acidiphilus TaxID=182455 RepID=UPI000836D948|nr:isochorismate synthase [Alicyclobacillus acidiphilus]